MNPLHSAENIVYNASSSGWSQGRTTYYTTQKEPTLDLFGTSKRVDVIREEDFTGLYEETSSLGALKPEGKQNCLQARWNKLSPGKKTAVKVALAFIALAALVGIGLVAMHYTCGIQAGFQTAGHWIANTAVPHLKTFLAKSLTVKNALLYIGLPSLGAVALTVIAVKGYKHVQKKRAEKASGRVEWSESSESGKVPAKKKGFWPFNRCKRQPKSDLFVVIPRNPNYTTKSSYVPPPYESS